MLNENPKINNAENSKIENPEIFFEKFKKRDDVAIIFLKGGRNGGLQPEVKAEILNQLKKWFEVIEGEEKKLSFDEIVARWGSGYLKYPTLEVMKENQKFDPDFIKKGEEFLLEKDEKGFQEWLIKAREISNSDVGLLRMEMLLDYYSSGGQSLLLKLKENVSREDILNDLEGSGKGALEENIPFQEFVKRFVVGNTTSFNALPGTLRSIVAKKIEAKKLLPCVDLWGESNDKWAKGMNLQEQKLAASNLLNAIHAPGSLEELELDINLLSKNDLTIFSEALLRK